MKKKKKVWKTIKPFFHNLRVLWKTPKIHAVMVLGLYILFFATIFVLLDFGSSDNTIRLSTDELFASQKTYTYQVTIFDITNYQKENILGEVTTLEERIFLERTDTWYTVDAMQEFYVFSWQKLRPSSLSWILEEGSLIATTNYVDQKKKRQYEFLCSQYDSSLTGTCQAYFLEVNNTITQVTLQNEQYEIEINFGTIQVPNE